MTSQSYSWCCHRSVKTLSASICISDNSHETLLICKIQINIYIKKKTITIIILCYETLWRHNTKSGVYNKRSTCNMYLYPQPHEPAWHYVTIVVWFHFLVVCFVIIAYVSIYCSSQRPLVRKSQRKRSRQWRKDNLKMQRRILFIG